MFEDIFRRKKLIPQRLSEYGFINQNGRMTYETVIMDGVFKFCVHIFENGNVDTELIEIENGEPYVLYKTAASGTFVGDVRNAIETVLKDISNACYEPSVFRSHQAQLAIDYVRETYGDKLEFLWTKFPANAVWRRQDNRKWYGAILTIIGKKIRLHTNDIVEIIDLRMNSDNSAEILSRKHYYPGWHMNKKVGIPSGRKMERLQNDS